MVTLVNRAKVATATTGTGTITLGSAESGYQTFADAGVVNSDVVRYTIEDGDAWEIGLGTYSAGTLTRGSIESSNSDLALNLTGNAVVYVTAAGEDIVQPSDLATVATSGAYSDLSGLPTLGTAAAADTGDFATAAQGALADSAVQPNDSPSFGSVTVSGTVDGRDVAADGSKLDGIEAGATADQTAGEIKTAYESNANTNAYTDAEQTKLAGIEATADVTDAGNVNPLVDAHLNTSSATSGEYLSWTGSDYDWVAVSGYTDADVDTHLNTGTASSGEVLSWNGSDYDWITSGGAFSVIGTNNLAAITTLPDITTGTNNFAAGNNAGANLTTGSNNVALGNGALDAATTGGRNIAIGQDAMGSGVSTASTGDNVAIGYQAGYAITTGRDNIAIGSSALALCQTGKALAIGANALSSVTGGGDNIAIGAGAMELLGGSTDGIDSVAIGVGSLRAGGRQSVAIGRDALRNNTNSGSRNTAVGQSSGFGTTSGANNVFVGFQAGDATTTGSNQIVIGQGSDASSATVSNEITLGNSSIATLRCQVTTITSLSDARDKADIQPLNAGLEFVEALNPVSFTWSMRDGGKVGEADTGFVAQDLQAAQADTGVSIPGLVYDVNPDKLEAGYGKLIPVLVQAIKDLSAKVEELEARLEGK